MREGSYAKHAPKSIYNWFRIFFLSFRSSEEEENQDFQLDEKSYKIWFDGIDRNQLFSSINAK